MLLLSAPLTLIVAIARVGINLEQFAPSTYGAVLAVAILSSVIYPPRDEPCPARTHPPGAPLGAIAH